MKKIIFLLLCLFICSCSTTKTLINYKGDGLLKEYKVTEHKEVKKDYSNLFPAFKWTKKELNDGFGLTIVCYMLSNLCFGVPLAIDVISTPFLLVYDSVAVKEKNYSYNSHAKFSGQIVNTDGTPVSNQNIQFGNKGYIFSNVNGNFEKTIDNAYSHFKNKKQYYPDEFILNFNNGKSEQDIKILFKNGKDVSINNPYQIHVKLDTENELYLYLEKDYLKEKQTIRSKNKDVIVLSSQTFSAQYYREEIEKAKENIKKKLKQNNISYITAEEIMLNSNGTLKDSWPDILIAFISAETRIKDVGAKNINVKGIVLNNGNFISEWKDNLEREIYIDILKQAKIKLEKQTGYTYYDSEVENIICDVESDFTGKQKKVKSNWKELVNKEIKKQQQLKWEHQQKIKRWKNDPELHVVQQQLNRCPNCYRYSLRISLLMKTGDPNHTWLMMYCPQCEYYNEELSGF